MPTESAALPSWPRRSSPPRSLQGCTVVPLVHYSDCAKVPWKGDAVPGGDPMSSNVAPSNAPIPYSPPSVTLLGSLAELTMVPVSKGGQNADFNFTATS
jgi:hypothetical protein